MTHTFLLFFWLEFVLYYFNKYGTMATSGVYTLNGENYVAQADGSLIKTPENGQGIF